MNEVDSEIGWAGEVLFYLQFLTLSSPDVPLLTVFLLPTAHHVPWRGASERRREEDAGRA